MSTILPPEVPGSSTTPAKEIDAPVRRQVLMKVLGGSVRGYTEGLKSHLTMVLVDQENERKKGLGGTLYRGFLAEAKNAGAINFNTQVVSPEGFGVTQKILGGHGVYSVTNDQGGRDLLTVAQAEERVRNGRSVLFDADLREVDTTGWEMPKSE